MVGGAESGDLHSDGVASTRDVGHALGQAAQPGTVIALVGPLGAGKTQVAKGIAAGLGVRSVVNSPTFILMNEHAGRLPMYHIDAYRLDDPEQALAAGLLDDRQAAGVTVIEWADRLAGWLPVDRLDLELRPEGAGGDVRRLRWRAHGADHARLARQALAEREARRVAAAS